MRCIRSKVHPGLWVVDPERRARLCRVQPTVRHRYEPSECVNIWPENECIHMHAHNSLAQPNPTTGINFGLNLNSAAVYTVPLQTQTALNRKFCDQVCADQTKLSGCVCTLAALDLSQLSKWKDDESSVESQDLYSWSAV